MIRVYFCGIMLNVKYRRIHDMLLSHKPNARYNKMYLPWSKSEFHLFILVLCSLWRVFHSWCFANPGTNMFNSFSNILVHARRREINTASNEDNIGHTLLVDHFRCYMKWLSSFGWFHLGGMLSRSFANVGTNMYQPFFNIAWSMQDENQVERFH